jgi:sulfite reductase (NADPH) flavoprotein alpha-component
MAYQVGNVAAILPENPPELVQKVLRALKMQPDQVFKIQQNGIVVGSFVPSKVSLKQIFTQYLDLNGRPTRTVLRAFLDVADAKGAERISHLLDARADNELKDYVNAHVTTAAVICDFAQYGVPTLDTLLSSLSHIQPRTYSITSTPTKHRRTVQIIVTKTKFGDGFRNTGLCSAFLEQDNLRRIALRIGTGDFRLPDDPETPLVLVALGIGIASFKALIESLDSDHRGAILLFGCRTRETNASLIEMIDKWKQDGMLTDAIVVCSRENPKKRVHIQEVMRENGALLWKYWQDPSTRLYYSGKGGSIADELKTIMVEIAMQQGNIEQHEAVEFNAIHPFVVQSVR